MRSFTIENITRAGRRISKDSGRYISERPSDAARKVFSKACTTKGNGGCTLIITIRETTQGSKKKEYTYNVSRKYDPIEVELKNGDVIEYKFTKKVKSMN
jgi:hypothetical protein